MTNVLLDPIDRRILRELQADATIPVAELAERVGLSPVSYTHLTLPTILLV